MNKKVIDAMRLIVGWRTMTDMCYNRSTCKNCEYNKNKSCDMISTEEVMMRASDIFYEYLAEADVAETLAKMKNPS